MRREEAEALCVRLCHEHPDRETHAWLPRRLATDTWSVVKVKVPRRRGVHPLLSRHA
jgi:hypothetical protein